MTQTIESSTCDKILFRVSPFSRNGGVMSRGRPAVLEYHSTGHSGVPPHTNKHIHLRFDHRIKPLWFPAWSVRSRLSPRLVSARQQWFCGPYAFQPCPLARAARDRTDSLISRRLIDISTSTGYRYLASRARLCFSRAVRLL